LFLLRAEFVERFEGVSAAAPLLRWPSPLVTGRLGAESICYAVAAASFERYVGARWLDRSGDSF
jgi:hypothetical protein